MQGYSIRKLDPANPGNVRGMRTWEWKPDATRQISVMRRRTGERFGNHFHKGEDPSKNPENILLLEGVLRVEFMTRNGRYSSETLDAANGPMELVMHPWLLHRFTGETDVVYIESRLSHFDASAPDTYPSEEFPHKFPSEHGN
jgi:hypothetical protein